MWKTLILLALIANVCIVTSTKDDCEKCGVNEVYSNCTNGGCGPKECSGLGYRTGCVKMDQKYCKRGCICKENYLRDDNGKCIHKSKCPECGGDPNAVWGCGVNCGRHCSDYNKGPVSCVAVCYNDACDCKKTYVFDDNTGKCVRPEECTPVCSSNEVFSTCVNGGCSAKNCSQIGKPVSCVKALCRNGCLCKDGFLRANNGTCVPKEECPQESQCNEGERYEECPDNLCTPRNCSQLGFPIKCPTSTNGSDSTCPGKPGCVCDNDFVKDKNGKCIPKDQCPSCGGDPHAVSGCGINCGRLCSNYKAKKVLCPRICKFNACDCKDGFVFDENLKKCVDPKNCTPTCGINEVYNECANGGCRKRDCSRPKVCIKPKKCEGGCICRDKYTRAKNGTCIPEDQCPPESQCPEGERYEECPDRLCSPKNCSQLGFPIECPALSGNTNTTCSGKPGCVCANDTVRGLEGKCVPRDQCPSCGGDNNATSGCGINCGRLCSNYKSNNTICPLICKVNACDCKKGYVFDDNIKQCVKPKDCTPICGDNEVYNGCANGGCRKRNCSEPILCIDPIKCEGGCICQENYTRAENGTCIPEDQCPPELKCNKPHEYRDDCPSTCPPETCDSIDAIYDCPKPPAVCRKPACRCEKGYCRNKINECISEDECKKCMGPNEYFSCGGACDNVCKSLKEQNQTNCPFVNIQCNRKCYCEENYARASNGTCIPISQCPVTTCNKPNEVYDECPAGCPPQVCGIDPSTVSCTTPLKPGDPKCEPGCRCADGYVRNSEGECIKRSECPKKKCKKANEVYDSCPVLCPPQRCDVDPRVIKCAAPPKPGDPNCKPGCRCIDGYLRNKDEICVPKDKCPLKCASDERYEECPDNLCRSLTCDQLGYPLNCPASSGNSTDSCPGKPGCICDDGKVRNAEGKCVSTDMCPSCGGDPNAKSGCGSNCGRRCTDRKKKNVACPLSCLLNGCDCKEGYLYDDKLKKCVLPKKCSCN